VKNIPRAEGMDCECRRWSNSSLIFSGFIYVNQLLLRHLRAIWQQRKIIQPLPQKKTGAVSRAGLIS